jgi:hypothetical protein
MRLRQVFFTIPIIAALSFALSAEGGRIIDATHYRAKNGVIECLQVRPLEWGGTFAFLARDAEVEAPDAGGSILISGGWDHYAMFGIDGELVEGYVLGELSLEVQGREIAVSAYSFGEGGKTLGASCVRPKADVRFRALDGADYDFMGGQDLFLGNRGLAADGVVLGDREIDIRGAKVRVSACDLAFGSDGTPAFGKRRFVLKERTVLTAKDGLEYGFSPGYRFQQIDPGTGLVASGAILRSAIIFRSVRIPVAWGMVWFNAEGIDLSSVCLDAETLLRPKSPEGKPIAFYPGWSRSIEWDSDGRAVSGVARAERKARIQGKDIEILGCATDFSGSVATYDASVVVLKTAMTLKAADGKGYRFASGYQTAIDPSGAVVAGKVLDAEVVRDGKSVKVKSAVFSWNGSNAELREIAE